MGKSSRRQGVKGRQASPRPLCDRDLIGGVRGPAGCTLRLARASDKGAVERLVALTGVAAEDEVLDGVTSDNPSSLIRTGIQEDKEHLFRETAVLLSKDGGLFDVITGMMTVIVAERAEGGVLGVLVTHPPANVLKEILGRDIPLHEAVVFSMAVAKVRGLAVDQAGRQHGIGSALLSLGTRLHFQFGSYLIYGQMATGRGLEEFYSHRGFQVLGIHESMSIDVLLGRPGAIGPENPEERLFFRWR